MHIITKKRFVEFAAVYADAAEPLKVWNTVAEAAKWGSIAEVRLTYPTPTSSTPSPSSILRATRTG